MANPLGLEMLMRMGANLIQGVDPAAAATRVEQMARAKGHDPADIWRVMARLSHERLDLLEVPECKCGCRIEPARCLHCGGYVPPPPVLIGERD